ncbi:transposase domain protein [Escherichia coli DEC5D]|nr:transposase domain protein [Escherichia coli DEC5D]
MILLQSKLEEVNKMAAHGELPDVEISDKGVKISPLDNCVPLQVSPLSELILQYVTASLKSQKFSTR